jgi:lipid A 3-O-deacylase
MSEKNRSAYRKCALAPLLLLAATHALADCEARANPRTPKGQWYLHWENDLFTRFASDEYFTNGLRVGYAWDPGCERRWIAREGEWLESTALGRKLGLGDPAKYTRSAMFGIGQSIYTPSNIRIAEALPDDHPYAAWLYALTHLDYTSPEQPTENWTTQRQHSFELQMGIVGHGAGGKEVQTWVHEINDDVKPQGWHHQLHNEPGLVLSYQWQRRYVHPSRGFDFTPSFMGSLGNVQTFGAAGITMRLGDNIAGFPSRPFEAARVSRGQLRDDHAMCGKIHFISECYVFVAGEARYVARNIFLDGNTFRDSPHVDSKPLVYDYSLGFRLRVPQWGLTFTYTFVHRTSEFDPVPATSKHRDGHHEYGVASFSWDTHF